VNRVNERQNGVVVARPLRIALVHASDLGGGAERSVVGLHRGLQALGHKSMLFVGERRTDELGSMEIPYVRGVPGMRRVARAIERTLGLQDIYNPSFRSLDKLIAGHFDVIHFNSLWGSGGYADIGALPALTRLVPGVITMRENWLLTGHCAYFHDCQRWRTGCGGCPDLSLAPAIPRDGTRANWRRKQRVLRASAVEIVAISEALKSDAESSPLFAGKRITRIYNGIDLETFVPAEPAARQASRRYFGIADEDIVVLLAGQTVEGIRKGIAAHHAIAALNRLASRPTLRVLAIGHSAATVAKELILPTTVLPFQSTPAEMARCYQIADLCLVTSEVEAFGRIAAEAQACATPVVAFDSGGIPEVVRHRVGGLIVPGRNHDGIVEALAALIDDATLRAKYGKLGQAYVRESFDEGNVAQQYVGLYRDVMSRHRSAFG